MQIKPLSAFLNDKDAWHRWHAMRDALVSKYEGIECDINERWEKGTPHHPKSIELMNVIKELDFYFLDDYFCWKTGGDGDNGEFLMYLLDIHFEKEGRE